MLAPVWGLNRHYRTADPRAAGARSTRRATARGPALTANASRRKRVKFDGIFKENSFRAAISLSPVVTDAMFINVRRRASRKVW